MTARHGQHLARWLLLVVTFLIVYGSLYPFRFAADDPRGLLELVGSLSWARTTRSDIAANVLLYLPFGACLAWMLAARLGGPLAVLATTAAGLLLSTGIEVAQIFETRRVASLADVCFNGLGTLAGSFVALALHSARHGFRRHPVAALAEPIATALLLLWLGYRLAPFALTLDPAQWRGAFRPLLGSGWFSPLATLGYLVSWLVVRQALAAILGRRDPARHLLLLMLATLAGLVVASGKALEPAELVGMALALALGVVLARLPEGRAAALVCGALVLMIAIEGLAPFDFRLDPDAFGFVPFRDALLRYRAANLLDMFEKCFLYGALVWLMTRAGLRVLAATVAACALVLGIELLQAWLPGRLAEITDPLLVVAAGSLIAVFDDPRARRGLQQQRR
jgi:VanZ family protein